MSLNVRGIGVFVLVVGFVGGGLAASQFLPADVAFGGAAAAGGAVLVVAGAAYAYQGHGIRTAEPDAVTDATAGGDVMLEGEARPAGETLSAPFTGREVLAYDYKVEEYTHDPDPDPDDHGPDYSWEVEASGERAVPFLLETDGGAVLVEADEATLDVDDDSERIETDSLAEASERTMAFLRENDIDPGGRKQRFHEDRLEPGETTFVSGTAAGRSGADRQLPDEASAVVGPDEDAELGEKARSALLPGAGFYVSDAPIEEAGKRLLVRGGVAAVVGLAVGAAGAAFALGVVG